MGGRMTFRTSLEKRLNVLQPSLDVLKKFLKHHKFTLSPGVKDLIQILHARRVCVFLVSGGFHGFIQPLAALLGIPSNQVYANKMLFDVYGNYAGFDKSQPTSEQGGKPAVVKLLKKEYGFRNVVMIGDGATDMEAAPPADAFIGYGGNVVRPAVKSGASWFVTDFNELIDVLQPAYDDDSSNSCSSR